MPDNLDIFGKTFTNATGIKATDTNGIVRRFTRPNGTISITTNGTVDVAAYETASVNVEGGGTVINNQDKTVSPTESQQTVTADTGYTGLGTVTVNAISSTYVGSEVARQATKTVTPTESEQNAVAANVYTTGIVKVGAISSTYIGSEVSRQAGSTVTPTESAQNIVAADTYVTGQISVSAIDSEYVGSNVTRRTSSDLIVSGATVTAPAGYYASSASASVASGSEGTPTATKSTVTNHAVSVTPSVTNTAGYITGGTKTGTAVTVSASELVSGTLAINAAGTTDVTNYANVSVEAMALPTAASSTYSGTSKASIGRSTSNQYINIPTGYNAAATYYTISATPNGSVTTPSSISGTTATVSTGTNTLTLTKSVSVTPNVTTAGYISSGTAGNASVSLTANVTTKAAATITPGTTNQTIASGTYLTGTQTISGDADLTAANIKTGVNIFNVAGTFTADANAAATDIKSGQTAYVGGSKITGTLVTQNYYTGSTTPASSLGNNGDIYLKVSS